MLTNDVTASMMAWKWHCRTRACLTAHEGNHIISEAITTIAR